MVITETKRIANRNRELTELQNIWNENCAPWMFYNNLRVFILNTLILVNSVQIELRKFKVLFLKFKEQSFEVQNIVAITKHQQK